MMKYLFTFLMLLVYLPLWAQQELGSYTETVEVAGADRQILYKRAEQWVKQLGYSVSFADSASGFISVGGEVKLKNYNTRHLKRGRLIYVVTLITEEGRYWYDFAQFFYEVVPTNKKQAKRGEWVAGGPDTLADTGVAQSIDFYVQQQIESLKLRMKAGGAMPVMLGNTRGSAAN